MHITPAYNETLTSSFSTQPINTTGLDGFCATINVTTTDCIGAFIVEGTVDQSVWVELDQTSSQMNVTGSSIVFKLNFLQIQDSYIRFTWIYASGTSGTATIEYSAKALGGTGRVAW